MLTVVLIEIRAVPAERSRGRHNPRAVKRKMSGFPTRSRAAPSPGCRFRYEDHVWVVAPVVPEPPAPALATAEPGTSGPPAPSRPAGRSPSDPKHLRHVRAWRASGLSRADYCRDQGLDQRTFHHWVARLRGSFRRKGRNASPRA